MGPIIQAVESRVKASILVLGGMVQRGGPEVRMAHYVPRAKQPTLLLSGRYDMAFPYETSAKPLYDLLGTPPEHKRHMVYEADHFVPQNDLVRESLAWLDRYLGRVE